MSTYRVTTRFDLNDAEERRAAEYLKGLKHGELNRFMINAVLAWIDEGGDKWLLEQIRRLFREEVKTSPASIVAEEAPEQREDMSVLDDLELFG